MNTIINRILEKKKKLDNYKPFPVEIIKNLGDRLRIELTYSSNAIEGNTLTRQQTARIIEDNISVGGKHINEIYEAKNHDEALQYIIDKAQHENAINQRTLLDIHAYILKNIDDTNAGSWRNVQVRISGSNAIFPNPLKVPDLMNEFESRLCSYEDSILLKAIEAHYRFVKIHPFVDGNGRTGRLLFNMILLQGGYPLSFVAKEEREEYIASLEKRSNGGDEKDYIIFMLSVIERSLDLYIDTLENKEPANEELLKIGQLAKKAGISVPTIRHRTEHGLLPVQSKTESGYALYNQNCITLCKEIQALKSQRYSVREIGRML